MSKVYADAVTSTEANQDLTLGGSGDNVIVTAGATLKTNTIKDSGGNTIWTSDGSGTVSSVNSAFAVSNMVLLTTNTFTNAASSAFTSSIDSTYKLYIFKYYDVNPATDSIDFSFQANAVGESGFNETMTTTFFRAYQDESAGDTAVAYQTWADQAQGTAYQFLNYDVGSGADESCAGELHLFNPSNTTYVKHFYSRSQYYHFNSGTQDAYVSGYFNTTAAIDEISFKMASGNMDGTIKMYGVG